MTMISKTYIPAAFGKKPETPNEALLAAAALLEEEGRWGQKDWFRHHNNSMEEYKDDPYCNSWHACADGALQIVTIGLIKSIIHGDYDSHDVVQWYCLMDGAYLLPEDRDQEDITPERLLYCEARDILDEALEGDSVEEFNDSNDRSEVIALLREAAQ